MTPLRSIKNQYLGVNAHLHSFWQDEAGWNNFHNPHIAELLKALRARLLPMGYTAGVEESLQIRREDEYSTPRADLAIYDLQAGRSRPAPVSNQQPIALTMTLLDVWEENPIDEKPYRAIAIRRLERGTPITWIEVLSPSNKRSGSDRDVYLQKRADLLRSGVAFVELDYLHESPPTLARIENYSKSPKPDQAYPYHIAVLDPRPQISEGVAQVYEFAVDHPMPTVLIPLSGQETLSFDFGQPYRKQFEEMLYGLEDVDYREFPLRFNKYSIGDQARIATRMIAVLEAAQAGHDLERDPQPLETLPLEEALARLERLNVKN